jgi:hypothetical protein
MVALGLIDEDIAMTQRDQIAKMFDEIVVQLEAAGRHARTAGDHFRGSEIPRGCAHALALEGHLVTARRLLDEIATMHAQHATT